MKITVVAKNINWCVQRLIDEAAAHGVELETRDIKDLNEVATISDLGDVVIWRNSGVDRLVGRSVVMNSNPDSFFFNPGQLDQPLVIFKSYQQKILEQYISNAKKNEDVCLHAIKSYFFSSKEELIMAVNEGKLRFPLIKKDNFGTEGIGVELISDQTELEKINFSQDCIYQNFIHNDGDYRVLVLGGRIIGAIKRIAQEESFKNNISQGASAEVVKDDKLLKELQRIALKTADIFGLNFCGVDIIYDRNEQCLRVMEVNTVPWWEGFEKATGINVAAQIVEFSQMIFQRKTADVVALTGDYYEKYFNYLGENKFHYASRMYFWKNEDKQKQRLLGLKNDYIGENEVDYENNLKKTFESRDLSKEPIVERNLRMPYFKRYPLLDSFNRVLFKVLFCEFIYGIDLRPIVRKIISEGEMIDMRNQLLKDVKALAVLSTYAVNFIYNLEYYLREEKKNIFNPEIFLKVLKDCYTGELASYDNLKIYLLTHCIINESRFYNKEVTRHKETYLEMIEELETLIAENYFGIFLDNKFEFLVCANILNYKSKLLPLIMMEAERSFSQDGNYLVDCLNDAAAKKKKRDFVSSEHRNVLFLMANQPYVKPTV